MSSSDGFLGRLRRGGIEPGDSEELRIRKSIVVFAMGMMTAAPMFWLALYWLMGLQLSSTLPLAYQVLSVCLLLAYVRTRNFTFFQYAQLALFLFFPFVVQLSIGNFISASGAVLWGMIAPVVAVPVLGTRRSIPWFVAHIALLCICGAIDLALLHSARPASTVPLRTSALFFTLNFVAISSACYFLLRYAAAQKERYEAELRSANALLRVEQERSEKLLLNILPEPIAERLKNEDQTIADGFADVTVMFADIVNFTQLAEGMSPNQIFSMLNRVFSAFDELAEGHGLEKIKTIGDAYMVAGGLNDSREIDYTRSIADMALDMCRTLAADRIVEGRVVEIRIGIGTGPVVAGVVGKKKFIYDVWGDTVNIASRITSEGGPGAIQVDATTYRRLKDAYDFQAPRTVPLKGKGETAIYRLIGRKPHDVSRDTAPEAA
ncbi:MAG: adenylate/guanylate cyclase domain-containing protein [Burkholderiales bacterium]|nr:adenylate/guanylate cyclase domain-containing protein [Burkholderiales bacterium]